MIFVVIVGRYRLKFIAIVNFSGANCRRPFSEWLVDDFVSLNRSSIRAVLGDFLVPTTSWGDIFHLLFYVTHTC